MNLEIVDKARQERKSPGALKIKLSQLRSRFQDQPILIVEGVEDMGPYEAWINRVINVGVLKMLPGSGKEQLLGLRTLLARDETGLSDRVCFAVDRDFDDLLGQEPGPDIFCTDRYSVESYVIEEHVVASVLRDELRLEEGSKMYEAAIKAYRKTLNELMAALTCVNFRIYCCRRLRVEFLSKVPEIRKFVGVHVTQIVPKVDDQVLADELPVATELQSSLLESLRIDFDSLDPRLRHRGKFLFQFLTCWIEKLIEEARNPSGEVFMDKHNIKFHAASLTLRSLATRSEMPVGFKEFVSRMVVPDYPGHQC